LTQDEKTALQKLEEFLKDNNIDLDYVEEDENYLDFMSDRMVVSRRQPPSYIIYTILHELGHYFSDFHPRIESKTTQVIEEVLAWDIGRDVAHSLGIDIDEGKWQELMISSIAKYIEK
jgi:hypothetical protein